MLKGLHNRANRLLYALLSGVLLAASVQWAQAEDAVISYTSTTKGHGGFIVDTRPSTSCEKASLSGARCLAALDFFGPHKRLANFSGVLWLMGTVGLTGNEHVLVIGDKTESKEAMAGLLYLSGQQKISVLTAPVSSLPNANMTPGTGRSKTREKIFQAVMRAEHIVLRSDLVNLVRSATPPVILDGRSESEYWGVKIRSPRGGHIPGAQHQPMATPAGGKPAPPLSLANRPPLAYAHNSFEGLVYLSRLVAGGVPARLYLEGWAGWASDGALPVDSVTYAEWRMRPVASKSIADQSAASGISYLRFAALGFGGLVLSIGGFFIGRSTHAANG